METLSLHFYKSVRGLQQAFQRMKKQMIIMYRLEDDRILEAEMAIRRLNEILKKLEDIAKQLAEEEKDRLAEEYEYYFGEEYHNPFKEELVCLKEENEEEE